ncbi:TetR/AcrR family transcriptional regulator [Arcanobacterium buesumense]|uniref:TetR family transcriptional regulator n=1 Tax=Arcanobacterium buesumense TaxID=2722751 RepID=A0A6H2EJB5_9ACTO|nr:TetR family transcriptional regulator [Arcanobacterium buesumense]QJC21290.1 TetR family transcriptional regulator [Arcanobacterium buesumense]
MRTSKKTEILQTIVDIIEELGISGVTYEAVANRSGMSKSGLIYHFPSREHMLREVHHFMASQWEQHLLATVTNPAAAIDVETKLRANLAVSQHAATRAELMMAIDASSDPDIYAIWADKLDNWTVTPDNITTDAQACQAYLVQLIADGLWAHDYINGHRLTPNQRKALADAAARLIPTVQP